MSFDIQMYICIVYSLLSFKKKNAYVYGFVYNVYNSLHFS